MAARASRADDTGAAEVAGAAPELTERIAAAASELRLEAIQPRDRQRARHCVLDWIGATVAGSAEPVAQMVQAVVRAEACAPLACVLGTGDRSGPQQAALANGVAAHALELDDVAGWMTGHPGASICSATFALAQARGLGGREALVAILAGYDAACKVGLALGSRHGAAGWHATGTAGTFAAAAACARLIELDGEATTRALGLAAIQASGLKAAIGTMGKPLQAGRAASNGILAALLAERGLTAPKRALEQFAATHSTTYDPQRPEREMDGQPGIRSVVFKRYACCGLANPTIAGIVALQVAHGFADTEVCGVELGVPDYWLGICAIPEPSSGLEGKFSLRFAAAVALAGRSNDHRVFSDEGVRDARLRELRDRVDLYSHGRADPVTEIEVVLTDGQRLQTERMPDGPAADGELDQQGLALEERFRTITVPLLGKRSCEGLVAAVAELEQRPRLGELIELARR